MHSKQHGVTLIELMIVVAVVAILAAIAYPSYRNQIMRSHRTEAKAALLNIQVAQEKYFLQNNSYGSLAQLGAASLGLTASNTTASGYYLVSLPTQTATGYQANADAQGGQSDDTHCATFTINQAGTRGATNTDCW